MNKRLEDLKIIETAIVMINKRVEYTLKIMENDCGEKVYGLYYSHEEPWVKELQGEPVMFIINDGNNYTIYDSKHKKLKIGNTLEYTMFYELMYLLKYINSYENEQSKSSRPITIVEIYKTELMDIYIAQ